MPFSYNFIIFVKWSKKPFWKIIYACSQSTLFMNDNQMELIIEVFFTSVVILNPRTRLNMFYSEQFKVVFLLNKLYAECTYSQQFPWLWPKFSHILSGSRQTEQVFYTYWHFLWAVLNQSTSQWFSIAINIDSFWIVGDRHRWTKIYK